MIRFRRTHNIQIVDAAFGPDQDLLARDLAALYEVPVPPLEFSMQSGPCPAVSAHRFWVRPLIGAGAVAIVAAVLTVLPAVWGSKPERVSAQEILSNANAAVSSKEASGRESYHLIATSSADKGAGTRVETWWADATHIRDENSAGSGSFASVVNGDEMWLAIAVDGQLHVAHAAGGAGKVFSQSPSPGSLEGFLASYDEACQKATIDGDGKIAGRAAYVIDVRPGVDCGDVKLREKASAIGNSVRMWIDKETFIPLKTEGRGNDGEVGYSYEVTLFETGLSIPGSTFVYHPAAGALVVDVASPEEAKSAISGSIERFRSSNSGESSGKK